MIIERENINFEREQRGGEVIARIRRGRGREKDEQRETTSRKEDEVRRRNVRKRKKKEEKTKDGEVRLCVSFVLLDVLLSRTVFRLISDATRTHPEASLGLTLVATARSSSYRSDAARDVSHIPSTSRNWRNTVYRRYLLTHFAFFFVNCLLLLLFDCLHRCFVLLILIRIFSHIFCSWYLSTQFFLLRRSRIRFCFLFPSFFCWDRMWEEKKTFVKNKIHKKKKRVNVSQRERKKPHTRATILIANEYSRKKKPSPTRVNIDFLLRDLI